MKIIKITFFLIINLILFVVIWDYGYQVFPTIAKAQSSAIASPTVQATKTAESAKAITGFVGTSTPQAPLVESEHRSMIIVIKPCPNIEYKMRTLYADPNVDPGIFVGGHLTITDTNRLTVPAVNCGTPINVSLTKP